MQPEVDEPQVSAAAKHCGWCKDQLCYVGKLDEVPTQLHCGHAYCASCYALYRQEGCYACKHGEPKEPPETVPLPEGAECGHCTHCRREFDGGQRLPKLLNCMHFFCACCVDTLNPRCFKCDQITMSTGASQLPIAYRADMDAFEQRNRHGKEPNPPPAPKRPEHRTSTATQPPVPTPSSPPLQPARKRATQPPDEENVDTLRCKRCSEEYDCASRAPKVLPCGHTCCLQCIYQLHKSPKCNALCPQCKNMFSATPRRIDKLPANLALLSVQAQLQRKRRSDEDGPEAKRIAADEADCEIIRLLTDEPKADRAEAPKPKTRAVHPANIEAIARGADALENAEARHGAFCDAAAAIMSERREQARQNIKDAVKMVHNRVNVWSDDACIALQRDYERCLKDLRVEQERLRIERSNARTFTTLAAHRAEDVSHIVDRNIDNLALGDKQINVPVRMYRTYLSISKQNDLGATLNRLVGDPLERRIELVPMPAAQQK